MLEVRTVPAAISGLVFNDTNADGIQNNNESSMFGVTVTLNSDGTSPLTTITDNFVTYSFLGVAPGNYSVAFTAPTGFSVGAHSVLVDTAPASLRAWRQNEAA